MFLLFYIFHLILAYEFLGWANKTRRNLRDFSNSLPCQAKSVLVPRKEGLLEPREDNLIPCSPHFCDSLLHSLRFFSLCCLLLILFLPPPFISSFSSYTLDLPLPFVQRRRPMGEIVTNKVVCEMTSPFPFPAIVRDSEIKDIEEATIHTLREEGSCPVTSLNQRSNASVS